MIDADTSLPVWNSVEACIAAIGVTGIVVWNCIPPRFAIARLLVQIAFFLTMTAMLPASRVVPYETTHDTITSASLLAGTVKLLWWIHLGWALIGFVRIYLVFEHKPREARLLQDLVVGVVYVGMVLSALPFVFAVPVGTLIATSGVFAIILGLALQNTLSDLFSGIALNLGRPYVLGDWIALSDGTEGRVVETNWRSTHLLTSSNNIVALPNSLLAKLGLTNLSGPDETHGLSINVRLATTRTPAAIVSLMNEALASCNSIIRDPQPVAVVRSIDALAIDVELAFRVPHVDQRNLARNELFDLVYRHARAGGLALASPQIMPLPSYGFSFDRPQPRKAAPIELISAMPLFSELTDAERTALAENVVTRTYRKGEIIVREGEELSSLIIVGAGVIALRRNGGKNAQHITYLAPGDFVGNAGLPEGGAAAGTLETMSHVVAYEIDGGAFASLIAQRPEIAAELAAILSGGLPARNLSDPVAPHVVKSAFGLRKAISTMLHAAPGNHAEKRSHKEDAT